MVTKKSSKKEVTGYIHMHSLLNKAGFNKEERRMAIYTPL